MIRALAQIAPPASRWAVPAACGWGGRRRPGGGRGASGRAPGGRGCWRPGSRRPAVRSPAPGRRRPGARRSGLGDDGRAAAGQDAGPALDHRPARGQQGPAGMQAVERLRLRPDLRHGASGPSPRRPHRRPRWRSAAWFLAQCSLPSRPGLLPESTQKHGAERGIPRACDAGATSRAASRSRPQSRSARDAEELKDGCQHQVFPAYIATKKLWEIVKTSLDTAKSFLHGALRKHRLSRHVCPRSTDDEAGERELGGTATPFGGSLPQQA